MPGLLICAFWLCCNLAYASAPAAGDSMLVAQDIDYLPGVDYVDNKDRLDIFMPGQASKVPVIVYFHGGALRMGNKNDGALVAEQLAKKGFGVVLANYRLSPGVQHPAHIEDAAAALAWVKEHILEYGGDDENLYVAGHSAGAYLAVLLAIDAKHLGKYGLSKDSIKGVIAISPFLFVEETAPQRPLTVWGKDPDNWLRASVTPHIADGKAPMLLIYADGDKEWRKKQILRFTAAMENLGNNTQAVEVTNRDHMTLISGVNADDDRIRMLVEDFVKGP